MSDTISRIKVSLHDGTIEIEGPEPFVEAQVKRFESVIIRSLAEDTGHTSRDRAANPPPKSHLKKDQGGDTGPGQPGQFHDVFTVTDGKVQIHKPIPGDNDTEKMASVAKLVVLALTLSGIEEVPSATVREVCSDQGCLNGPNFARTMKKQRALFVFSGRGQKLTLKFSAPGKREALEFAKSLDKQDES